MTRGTHGPITETEIARVVETCAADVSPSGKRDAVIIYLAAEMGIPLEVLVGLNVGSACGDRLQLDRDNSERLPEPGFRLMQNWLCTRGLQAGPLLARFRAAIPRPLTVSALRAVLTRRCVEAGVVPFTAADILRTRQARLCGSWSRSCCVIPYGPLPVDGPAATREVEPLVIRALSRLGTEKRLRTTKLLTLFAAELRPPAPAMSVPWGAISDEEIESVLCRMAGTIPLRQINAARRAVLFVRRGAVAG